MTNFRIVGIGTALPQHSISQQGAATFAATVIDPKSSGGSKLPTLIQGLYRRARVQSRYSVLLESSSDTEATAERFYRAATSGEDRGPSTADRMNRYELEAPRIARQAAAAALQAADLDPGALTHLVTVSCSGFYAPGIDCHLQQQLGLSPSIARVHVGFMGCHGALNGLRVAHAFVQSDPAARVMVCAVELCSLHHQYGWDPQKIVANSLFADGAAALIGCADRRPPTEARLFPGSLVDSYSLVVPETAEVMTWRIGDHGFEMSLAPELPELIKRELPAVLEQFLGRHGLTRQAIRSWAIHPGGPRILSAVADAAQLTAEELQPSLQILQRFGNMSSPTVLFILEELRARNAELPCVLLGFGPGLNVEMALLC